MGILISRFRRKPTVRQQLEKLEQELENIEDFKFDTQYRQKRYLGFFVAGSIAIYAILLVAWLIYFPDSLLWKIISSLAVVVLIPVIFYFIRRFMLWYYSSQISRNNDQIQLLHRQKKKLLMEVKDKETYNVAKELLQKYDPEEIKKAAGIGVYQPLKNAPDILSRLPEMELRKRASTLGKIVPMTTPRSQGAARLSDPGVRPLTPPSPIIKPGYNAPPGTKVVATVNQPRQITALMPIRPAGIPMPCPILPRDRSILDKVVEYVVGDGPSNRYALICRQCKSHNGMALKEEFEYIAFRCCYCYLFNPARKQRLIAPRLTDQFSQPTTRETSEDAASSSSPEESGSDANGDECQPDDQVVEDADKDENAAEGESEAETSNVHDSANTASIESSPIEPENDDSTVQQASQEQPSLHEGEDTIHFADDDSEHILTDSTAESKDVSQTLSAQVSPVSSSSSPPPTPTDHSS